VNVTLVLDEQPLTRAPLKAEALGKSLDELIGELLQGTLAEDDSAALKSSSGGQGRAISLAPTQLRSNSRASLGAHNVEGDLFPQLSTTKFPLSVTSNLY
jgi:hypothetical protein